MKNNSRSIKKVIKKRIEFSQKMSKSSQRSELRRTGVPKIVNPSGSRNEIRTGIKWNHIPITSSTVYNKKKYVDYDVVISIPSYDRYLKVKRLISQFYDQSTMYTFKIVLLNDGSPSKDYDELSKIFPEIIYLKNDKPNGKKLHWYCYNQLWEFLKNIECHAVLQTDDDFIICDNFLNKIVDIFFDQKNKNNNVRGISPHMWSFSKYNVDFEAWWNKNDFVDGISLLDIEVIKAMNYEMHDITTRDVTQVGAPVGAWDQINDMVRKMNGFYYRTSESLAFHDGNDDSKLHGDHRSKGGKGIYTKKITESLKKYIV